MRAQSTKVFAALVALAFLGVTASSMEYGAWTPGGIVVDSLCRQYSFDTSNRQQFRKALMPDGSGGLIVTWMVLGPGTPPSCPSYVYAQRIDAAGNRLWGGDGKKIAHALETGVASSIVPSGTDEAIVCWTDDAPVLSARAQKIDFSGNRLWDSTGVLLCFRPSNDLQIPRMISDDTEGAIVSCWHASGPYYGPEIFLQRVNPEGRVLWDSLGLILAVPLSAGYPWCAMASDGSHGAIVAWGDGRNGASYPTNDEIYAQRVDALGVRAWDSLGAAVCTAPGDQRYPDAIADGAGGVFVVWEDWRSPGYGIYAQRIDAQGAPLWRANGIKVSTPSSGQVEPIVISDGEGGVIIVWRDNRGDDGPAETYDYDIYAQRFTGYGVPVWAGAGVAICNQDARQEQVTACPDGDHGAIVAWIDLRDGVKHIFAQRIDGAGAVKWRRDGIPIATEAAYSCAPYACGDGETGAFLYWFDVPGWQFTKCLVQHIDSRFDFPAPPCSVSTAYLDSGAALDEFLVGCPGGDEDTLRLTLSFEAAAVPRDIEADEIGIGGESATFRVWSEEGAVTADSAAACGDNVRTTVTAPRVFGHGAGEVGVALGGEEIVTASVTVKSPDYNATGAVTISDLVYFGGALGSCGNDAGYNDWFDFDGDSCVGAPDLDLFAFHYQHDTSSTGGPGERTIGTPRARMRLVLETGEDEEHQPLLLIRLLLAGAEHIATFCTSLGVIEPAIARMQWAPSENLSARSMAAFPGRGGCREAFIAAWGLSAMPGDEIELGTLRLTFRRGREPDPADAIRFIFGEVMSMDGAVARISGAEFEDGEGRALPAFRDFLYDAFPNPFNPSTMIRYSTASDGPVELAIYDVRGRLIRTLAKGPALRNTYTALWDGKDNRGSRVASGVYFCRLKTPACSLMKKLVALR